MGETVANARATERVHRRRIAAELAISKHEVTADQYQRFITDLLKKGIKVRDNSRYSPNGFVPPVTCDLVRSGHVLSLAGGIERGYLRNSNAPPTGIESIRA